MSAKKDPMVNIGGFLAVNDHGVYEDAANLAVIYEGLHTYGGWRGAIWRRWRRGLKKCSMKTTFAPGSDRFCTWGRN